MVEKSVTQLVGDLAESAKVGFEALSGILQDVAYDCMSPEHRLSRIHVKATAAMHKMNELLKLEVEKS